MVSVWLQNVFEELREDGWIDINFLTETVSAFTVGAGCKAFSWHQGQLLWKVKDVCVWVRILIKVVCACVCACVCCACFRALRADGVCESVLYGLPLVIRSTTCWQLDWDEMETNYNLFHALCHTLRVCLKLAGGFFSSLDNFLYVFRMLVTEVVKKEELYIANNITNAEASV